MERNDIYDKLVKKGAQNNLLILPTGYGKSKLAIDYAKLKQCHRVLVVVPKLVLIKNWEDELAKWKYEGEVKFTTYASVHKQGGNSYDMVIWDEAHHITERVMEYIPTIITSYSILLSATVKRDKLWELKDIFPNLNVIKHNLKDAIDEEILPEPKIFLIEMSLSVAEDTIVIRPKEKNVVKGQFIQLKRLKAAYPKHRIEISCTQLQKNMYYTNEIDFWKRRYMFTQQPFLKNRWLQIAGERLKWLSSLKTDTVKDILAYLKKYRVLTFCSSIEQTKLLGENDISSKNKKSKEILAKFNAGEINHITSVNILAEGVNLVDCQVGIFAGLNSSELLQCQKQGRLLRHKNPYIIVPYYKNTRDEEIVTKMFEGYDVNKVKIETLIEYLK